MANAKIKHLQLPNGTTYDFHAVTADSATSATSASKLGSATVGSATKPIYLNGGTAMACTYSLNKTVPSDAVFTDTNTHRPIQINGTEILGNNTTALNLKAGSNVWITSTNGTVTIEATDTDTTYTLSADTTNNEIKLTPSSGFTQSITVPYARIAGSVSIPTANPEIATYYMPIFGYGTGDTDTPILYKHSNDYTYYLREGTTSHVGESALILGNGVSSGTDGNSRGELLLYSEGAVRSALMMTNSGSGVVSTYNHYLPAVAGTIGVFTATPTSGQVVVTDGTAGGFKTTGYTIAKSVPSDAKFTDTTYSAGTGLSLSGTSFSVNNSTITPYEAKLQWGGKDFSADYGCIDAAMVNELGANRLMFTPGSAVTIEYSRDNGSTWTDYGASNTDKTALFSSGANFYIGKADSSNKATANGGKYQLRVTIDTGAASIYTVLNKLVIYVSTNGSAGCKVKIQKALQSTPTTFVDHKDWTSISGWSGYNVLNIASLTTYGNTAGSQYGRVRFIFADGTGGNTSFTGLNVNKIMGFGGVGWNTPSTMAKTGHLYSFDASQNATFPAQVTATKFVGALQGNVTGNCSGSSATSTISTYLTLPRVAESCNALPDTKERIRFREYSSGANYNLPTTDAYYHIFEARSTDTKYGTQFALGMNGGGVYYRRYHNSSWTSWQSCINTNTWRPIGTGATDCLAGNTKYAGASTAGGSATSAAKLDTSTAGSATQPCYFANGVPTACTYSLNKTVPSDAVFTDTNTTYTLSADTTNNKITLTPSSGSAQSITVPYATSAGGVAWGNVTGKPSSFTPASHTHGIADITWAGNANLKANASANNQEWSIDLTPGSYTGTYWQIWSGKNSKTILACYTDTNDVKVPNGSFYVTNGEVIVGSGIELGTASATSPSFIDFHWNTTMSGNDFTARIWQRGENTVDLLGKNSSTWGIWRAGSFSTQSSIHAKENIQDITVEDSRKLLQLRPVTFNYKNGGLTDQAGLIAEEVYLVMPKMVIGDINYNPEEPWNTPSIDYSKFVPYLIKMIQEQQKEIDELRGLVQG